MIQRGDPRREPVVVKGEETQTARSDRNPLDDRQPRQQGKEEEKEESEEKRERARRKEGGRGKVIEIERRAIKEKETERRT